VITFEREDFTPTAWFSLDFLRVLLQGGKENNGGRGGSCRVLFQGYERVGVGRTLYMIG